MFEFIIKGQEQIGCAIPRKLIESLVDTDEGRDALVVYGLLYMDFSLDEICNSMVILEPYLDRLLDILEKTGEVVDRKSRNTINLLTEESANAISTKIQDNNIIKLYIYLLTHQHTNQGRTTRAILGKIFNISVRTVQRRLNILKELGLIEIIKGQHDAAFLIKISQRCQIHFEQCQNNSSEDLSGAKIIPIEKTLDSAIRNTCICIIDNRSIIDNKTITSNKSIIDYKNKTNIDPNKTIPYLKRLAPTSKQGGLDKLPSLPSAVKEWAEENPNIEWPPEKVGIHVAALWYWAHQRWLRRRLDHVFTKENFKQSVIKFQKNIVGRLDKDWGKIKQYIDWYISQRDKFIKDECGWGIEFLTSVSCLNRFFKVRTRDSESKLVITTPAEYYKKKGYEIVKKRSEQVNTDFGWL